jgi:hypothetical protein
MMDVVRAEFSSTPREESPHHAPAQPRELVDPISRATIALEQAHRQAALIKGLL